LETATQISSIESQIVQLLKASDQKAIELIYKNYSDALYGVVYRIVNDEQIAEDVMQESFVKIWKNASAYNPELSRLFTWLVNICRNTSIDQVRLKGYRKSSQIRKDENAVINKASDSTAHQPEHIGLKELIHKLKPEQKELIELAYFEGYTQQELADELSIPIGTVKTRMRAAIIELRKYFK